MPKILTPFNACADGHYWGCNNLQPQDRCGICMPKKNWECGIHGWPGILPSMDCEGCNPPPKADYERPILTVDVVCFTLIDDVLHVLLMKRDREPFFEKLALPGGYIHVDEDKNTLDAAKRVTKEKLGIDVPYLEQLGTFSGLSRDPRGWSASVSYIAVVQPSKLKETAGFYPVGDDIRFTFGQWKSWPTILAFDHWEIIDDAVKRIRDKSTYSSLPLFFMNKTFTLTDLQTVYESMMQESIDKASFRRKILEQGIVEPTGEVLGTKKHRPARLFRPTKETLKLFKSTIG